MAIPVRVAEVEQVLQPWLGSLFLGANRLVEEITAYLSAYAPYRQTLQAFRDGLESLLLRRLNSLTNGSLTVALDNRHTRLVRQEELQEMTDDLMGIIFNKLTPFSENFIKLNDYSLHVDSLNVLRVLYLKYASYYSEEERHFLVQFIRQRYPAKRYEAWLKEQE